MIFDGTWQCTIDSPMGQQTATFTFVTDAQQLSGVVRASGSEAAVTDGRIDGNRARWKCSISRPMSLTLDFDAQLNDDNLSGTVKLGAFGTARFSGTRV